MPSFGPLEQRTKITRHRLPPRHARSYYVFRSSNMNRLSFLIHVEPVLALLVLALPWLVSCSLHPRTQRIHSVGHAVRSRVWETVIEFCDAVGSRAWHADGPRHIWSLDCCAPLGSESISLQEGRSRGHLSRFNWKRGLQYPPWQAPRYRQGYRPSLQYLRRICPQRSGCEGRCRCEENSPNSLPGGVRGSPSRLTIFKLRLHTDCTPVTFPDIPLPMGASGSRLVGQNASTTR